MSQESNDQAVGCDQTLALKLTHAAIACVLEGAHDRAQSALQQVVTVLNVNSLELALALDQLSTVCLKSGRVTEARHFAQRSLQIKRHNDGCKGHPTLAVTLTTLAAVLRAEKSDHADAQLYENEAASLLDAVFAVKS